MKIIMKIMKIVLLGKIIKYKYKYFFIIKLIIIIYELNKLFILYLNI